MKASIDYIREKFQQFNQQMFNGELKPIRIYLNNKRSSLGELRYLQRRLPSGKVQYYDFHLFFSTQFDMPEDELGDIIIHEMIHYFIVSKQLKDNAPHGNLFRSMMNDINVRFNRHITISHRSHEPRQDRDSYREHIICVSRWKDGKTGVSVVARTRLYEFWNLIPSIPGCVSATWYYTFDSYFNKFPRVITPKFYVASPDELKEHLSTALELEKVGNVIRPK